MGDKQRDWLTLNAMGENTCSWTTHQCVCPEVHQLHKTHYKQLYQSDSEIGTNRQWVTKKKRNRKKVLCLFKMCVVLPMCPELAGDTAPLPHVCASQFCGISALQHNCREGGWLVLNIFFSFFLDTLLLSSSSLCNADSDNCESQCQQDSAPVLQLRNESWRTAVFWKRESS